MTDNTSELRDGLPTVEEIRQAAALLQIPLDEDRMGLADVPEGRQVTAMLAVLGSWINAYQVYNDFHRDRLDPDQMQMLVASAESEVQGDMPDDTREAMALNAAIWRLQWAGYIIREIGRSPHPRNPADAITLLIRGTLRIVECWRDKDLLPGVQLDQRRVGAADPKALANARKDVVAALSAINRLLGGASSAGGQ